LEIVEMKILFHGVGKPALEVVKTFLKKLLKEIHVIFRISGK